MKIAPDRRLALVWLVLTALTLSYLWVDHAADRGGTLRPSTAVTTAVILISLIKVRLIAGQFMEVRGAPMLLRRLTDLWVVLIAAALLASYLTGATLR